MDTEELKTAQASEDTAGTVNQAEEQVGTADTDNQQTETDANTETNDADFSEGETDGNDQPAEEPKKEPQSKERNAEEARKRREAEKQEAIKKARVEAIIEAMGGKNPYTNAEMTDADDVEEYLNMKKIEKDGKDPIADYASWTKQQAKARKAEQEAQEAQEAKARDDIEAFRKAHPDVDTNALFKDEAFTDYAEGKLGNRPLTQIYDGYQKLVGGARKAEQEKAAQALANSRATPGSVQSQPNGDTEFFTVDQVRKMSPQEVRQNYDKIMKSMKKW